MQNAFWLAARFMQPMCCFVLLAGCDIPDVNQPPANQSTGLAPALPPGAHAVPPGVGLPPGAHFEQSAKNLPPTGNRVELTAGVIEQLDAGKYKASLTYRFTAGQPDPAREYAVNVQFVSTPYSETETFPGNELAEQGTLQWDFSLPIASGGKLLATPTDFTVSLNEEETRNGRKGYAGRSNRATGTVVAK